MPRLWGPYGVGFCCPSGLRHDLGGRVDRPLHARLPLLARLSAGLLAAVDPWASGSYQMPATSAPDPRSPLLRSLPTLWQPLAF